VEVHLFQ